MKALIIILTVPLFVITAQAKYGGGTGEPNDPYLIYTAGQLNAIGTYRSDWNKHFKLMADVDLSTLTGTRFNIIGDKYTNPFTGVFDGNGHTISHLTITSRAFVALFGRLSSGSEVRDLGLVDVNIGGSMRYVASLVGLNGGNVIRCYSSGEVNGAWNVGGLVGMNDGAVIHSYSTCVVNGDETVGGLVGYNGRGNISCSYSNGIVNGNREVGGLVGFNWLDTVIECYSTGTVNGVLNVGGLVGYNLDGDVINSYSTCEVSGNENVGGLVGGNERTIRNCYATGSITGTTNVGGLVGSNDADVINSFWDTLTSGQTTSAGGTGKMTAEMHISLTFFGWGGWDNEGNSVWTIDEGNDYPRLWWENAPGQVIEPTPQLLTHATNPSPADGDLQKDTWVNLSWKPGDFAVSHEVYFGNSLEKVKNGDEDTFQGKQTETYFTVGLPGHLYPKGLVPEVTYYWRIDEVDDKQAYGIKQCGDVWSFKVVHKIAYNPNPPDGAIHEETWVTLSWMPGYFTVSHDVYIGDNFEDVDNGITDTFRGNQTTTFYVPGFPGYSFPDGLIPGTTYYWRIDEVNEAEPNSPWKGNVWSFMVPPRTAYNPDPTDGAEFVDPNTILSWTAGFDGKMHIVYIGTDFDDVNDASGGIKQVYTNYSPGSLESGKVYYWRIDEFDGANTYKGDVWSFTTLGSVGNPVPSNGAKDVKMTATLSWTPADNAASHEVFFGENKDAVRNADTNSPEYKGSKALGDESYNPGKLAWYAMYYWRVDEVDNLGNSSKGPIWSFTTANFIVVDDFESYKDHYNEIWFSWHDGLGCGAYGNEPYYLGNGTGAVVGDETGMWGGHMETEIVHGGRQSMPYCYDNDRLGCFKYSEATLTLGYPRDWTEEGVGVLSLWFYGTSANAPEPMYVAIANNTSEPAVVYHDDPSAAGINTWTEWVIPLQTFAEQGIDLTDVDSFAIGFGDRYNPQPGGGGLMYFDDIRLYRPRPAESLDLEANVP